MSNTNPALLQPNRYPLLHLPASDSSPPFANSFEHQPLPPLPPPSPTLAVQELSTPPPSPQPSRFSDYQAVEVGNKEADQDIPLTAAGLTRALETNQGQPLTEIINISTSNPSHLFWVPASQHPELAPAEFEKYVTALRANAKDKGKVRRRRSVLSVSFTANDDDLVRDDIKDDNEESESDGRQAALDTLESKRNRLSLARSNSLQPSKAVNTTDQNDDHRQQQQNHPHHQEQEQRLQHKDERAAKVRKEKLRRSMSLQLSGNLPDGNIIPDFLVFDRNSTSLDQSPVLVPKTDRPLSRRGARTKFQRSSSIAPTSAKLDDDFTPPEKKWPIYRHSDSVYTSSSATKTTTAFSSNSHENLALEDSAQGFSLTDDPITFEPLDFDLQLTKTPLPSGTPAQENNHPSDLGITTTITPMDMGAEQATEPCHPTVISANENITAMSPLEPPPPTLLQEQQSTSKLPSRERKSSWSWSFWSDDKKVKAEQQTPSSLSSTVSLETQPLQQQQQQQASVSSPKKAKADGVPTMTASISTPTVSSGSDVTNSDNGNISNNVAHANSKKGFGFSSLFSRKSSSTTTAGSTTGKKTSRKASEDTTSYSSTVLPPKDFQLNKINHQSRLPIHVERAVYRLSHMKLANPRRPLRDQVIISNFMFWYLTIISQQQQQPQPQSQQQGIHSNTSSLSTSTPPPQNQVNNPRHSPPRTPQQIVAASKKKRLTKKNPKQQQQQQQKRSTPSGKSANHKNTSSRLHHQQEQNLQQQRHYPYPSSTPPSPSPSSHQVSQDKSWHTDRSQHTSTGFIVPENYLRPASESDKSTDQGTKHRQSEHQRRYVRRNSSSSEEDDPEDEDDEDVEEDEDDENDTEDHHHKRKSKKKSVEKNYDSQPQQQWPHHRQGKQHSSPSSHDSVPLAMYKKAAMS